MDNTSRKNLNSRRGKGGNVLQSLNSAQQKSNGNIATNGYITDTHFSTPVLGQRNVDSESDVFMDSVTVDQHSTMPTIANDVPTVSTIANDVSASVSDVPTIANDVPTIVPTTAANVPTAANLPTAANVPTVPTVPTCVNFSGMVESLRGYSSQDTYSIGISFSSACSAQSEHELLTKLHSWAQSEGNVDVEVFVNMMKTSDFMFNVRERINQTRDNKYYYNTPTNGSCAMMLQAQLYKRWDDCLCDGDVGVQSLQKSLFDINVVKDRKNLLKYVQFGMKGNPDPECNLYAQRIIEWVKGYNKHPKDFPSEYYPSENFTMKWNSSQYERTLWMKLDDEWDLLVDSSAVTSTLQFTHEQILRIFDIAPNFYKCDNKHYYLKKWCRSSRVIPQIEEAFRNLIHKIVEIYQQNVNHANFVDHSAGTNHAEPELTMEQIYATQLPRR